jgi:DNA-binding MarR family transcriptional regulator
MHSFNFPSNNIRNQNLYKFISSPALCKKNYDTYYNTSLRCFSKKPGPKDGWHGITLKILNYIAKRNGCSIRDLCKEFNIARQNIHYHINKLLKAGLIERCPHDAKKHNPYVFYAIKSCRLESSPFFNGASYTFSNSQFSFNCSSQKAGALRKKKSLQIIFQILELLSLRPQTPKMLKEKLKIKDRTLRYYTNKLIKSGLIIRAGGNNCKYAYLIYTPKPIHMFHSHNYTKYHRRYRRMKLIKALNLKTYKYEYFSLKKIKDLMRNFSFSYEIAISQVICGFNNCKNSSSFRIKISDHQIYLCFDHFKLVKL